MNYLVLDHHAGSASQHYAVVITQCVVVCLHPREHGKGSGSTVRHHGVDVVSFAETDMGKSLPGKLRAGPVHSLLLPLQDARPGHRGQAHPVPHHQHDVLGQLCVGEEVEGGFQLSSSLVHPVACILISPPLPSSWFALKTLKNKNKMEECQAVHRRQTHNAPSSAMEL